jgi:hypothetical protein
MKTISVLLLALLAVSPCFADEPVNGFLYTDNGQRVLHLWGTEYEMGYAHGYLLGEEIMRLLRVHTFPPPGATPVLYEWARGWLLDTFDIDEAILSEAQGVVDGMLAAGVPAYVDVIERNFDSSDIVVFTGLADIMSAFCATLIGWGPATQSEFDGRLIAAHNSDFLTEEEDPGLPAEATMIFAYSPSVPGAQRYISVASVGYLGLAAGMNESGIGILINKGSAELPELPIAMDPKPHLGAVVSRWAIQAADPNASGENTIDDPLDYFDPIVAYSQYLCQLFGPVDRSDPPSATFEINYYERALRVATDNPTLAPDMIMTLNWEDKLVPQLSNYEWTRRKTGMLRIENRYGRDLTLANFRDFLVELQMDEASMIQSIQSMIFDPEQMRLGLAIANEEGDPAPYQNLVWHDFEDLFSYPEPEGDDDDDSSDEQPDPAAPDDDDAANEDENKDLDSGSESDEGCCG